MDDTKSRLNDLRIERPSERETKSRALPLLILLVVLLLLGGIGGLIWWLKKPALPEVQTMVVYAASGNAGDRTVLNASGYVTARRTATVSSKVTGKVTEVLLEEGMKVQEGQVLARLDDTNVKASLRLAEAQLVSATNALAETRVRIVEAEQELKRQTELMKNKIATQADYDHAEAAALALKARLEQQKADIVVAERQVASWQQQLEDTIIRAPFTGMVTSKNAQPGEMISPISAGGGFTRTGIGTVVDMTSLEIEVDVNESYITRVEPGQAVEATLDAYPDWKIPCKVIAIIPTADRQKATVKVRVGFDKLDKRILPEMSVKVAFRESGSASPTVGQGMTLPNSALIQKDGQTSVLVISQGRAQRRAVTTGPVTGNEVVIYSGLNNGEKVATNPPVELADGALVKEVTR